jgi:transcriptional regulator with XRE-family HTH domain
MHLESNALALRASQMATSIVSVETREVVRCEYCRLMQYRTSLPVPVSGGAGMQVASQVRELRRARHLSQRQLAGRMLVPRTYISKIENGKAIPTLGSLERLANALGVEMRQLVRDERSLRDEEVEAILNDPFLAEVAPLLQHLDSLHRTLFFGAVRDAAAGRRRIA